MEVVERLMKTNFWKHKRVLVTGHSGFKGGWMSVWLNELGANVVGYSLAPLTENNLYSCLNLSQSVTTIFSDIRNLDALQEAIELHKPDVIFHLAAQPLVRESYSAPINTYSTNVIGTLNVLEAALHSKSVRVVVNVTTDKCYENNEWCWGYRENEPLGGHDPYSSSKACSELITASYLRSFYLKEGKGLASARAGNVIGGGDWAKDRLVPDLIDAFHHGQTPRIRNPNSTRPWQHVLEPVSGYLLLAEKLWENPSKFSGAWNIGPEESDAKSVSWIADALVKLWGETVSWSTDIAENVHEANSLKLDISKAKTHLGWRPTWNIQEALSMTADWYKKYYDGQNGREVTVDQILKYSKSQKIV